MGHLNVRILAPTSAPLRPTDCANVKFSTNWDKTDYSVVSMQVNSVAIVEDTGGFSGIIVAAHELGHL